MVCDGENNLQDGNKISGIRVTSHEEAIFVHDEGDKDNDAEVNLQS